MAEEIRQSSEIEHAKKLAREANKAAKKPKNQEQFYTVKDGKVLLVKFKSSGAYSTYVGNKKKWDKLDKGAYAKTVGAWKDKGLWISEEDYQEKSAQIIEKLQAKENKKTKE